MRHPLGSRANERRRHLCYSLLNSIVVVAGCPQALGTSSYRLACSSKNARFSGASSARLRASSANANRVFDADTQELFPREHSESTTCVNSQLVNN